MESEAVDIRGRDVRVGAQGVHLEKNLEELQVLKSKWKGIREKLVRRLLEEQDKVFRCYYAAKWGGKKELGAGGEETGQMQLGGEVYVTCKDMGR